MNEQIARAEQIAKALVAGRGHESALAYAKDKYRSYAATAKRTGQHTDTMLAISWVRVINAIEPVAVRS